MQPQECYVPPLKPLHFLNTLKGVSDCPIGVLKPYL